MVCYNCGGSLSEYDFCTNCGVDVALYKKIMFISNRFYNDGLEKATVRDLSGAVASLRQSIKFNKNNIAARNLLGLVYFEMGEVVSALGEWVISKNLSPKKNIADDYIDMIQTNQSRLDAINQTIKKYNQALAYCRQDSNDLAVIQLKKVLSYNPKFVRAHQLLALLYINSEEWEKANKELYKCSQIDINNTTTLRYQREVEKMLVPEGTAKNAPKKKTPHAENVVRYRSGNETIIQPVNGKQSKGASTLLNLGIGVAIGMAIACFLILPGQIQNAKAGIADNLRDVSEQLDAKTATIDEQVQEIQRLKDESGKLAEELAAYQGTDGAIRVTDGLMLAVDAYLKNPGDIETIAARREALEEEEGQEEANENKTEAYMELYGSFVSVVGRGLTDYYYNIGHTSYRNDQFAEALPNLLRAYQYDEKNGDALFYLGNCYRATGEIDKAKEVYAKVIDDFPGTVKASRAETYLAEINNAE